MGRDAGHIALNAGSAGGADVILIPEISYSIEKICSQITKRQQQGKNYSLIIVAEAVRTEDGQQVTNSFSVAASLRRYRSLFGNSHRCL